MHSRLERFQNSRRMVEILVRYEDGSSDAVTPLQFDEAVAMYG
jgi:hypothetical protein